VKEKSQPILSWLKDGGIIILPWKGGDFIASAQSNPIKEILVKLNHVQEDEINQFVILSSVPRQQNDPRPKLLILRTNFQNADSKFALQRRQEIFRVIGNPSNFNIFYAGPDFVSETALYGDPSQANGMKFGLVVLNEPIGTVVTVQQSLDPLMEDGAKLMVFLRPNQKFQLPTAGAPFDFLKKFDVKRNASGLEFTKLQVEQDTSLDGLLRRVTQDTTDLMIPSISDLKAQADKKAQEQAEAERKQREQKDAEAKRTQANQKTPIRARVIRSPDVKRQIIKADIAILGLANNLKVWNNPEITHSIYSTEDAIDKDHTKFVCAPFKVNDDLVHAETMTNSLSLPLADGKYDLVIIEAAALDNLAYFSTDCLKRLFRDVINPSGQLLVHTQIPGPRDFLYRAIEQRLKSIETIFVPAAGLNAKILDNYYMQIYR
jgi:hypothetical protein